MRAAREHLFGIEEIEPADIVRHWADLFARQKKFGWPEGEYREPEELILLLRRQDIKGYKVESSYGMSGRVLAVRMEVRRRDAKKLVAE